MDRNVVEFICEYGISANQFLLCWFLKFDEKELLMQYVSKFSFNGEEIEDLIKKNLIIKHVNNDTSDYLLSDLKVTEIFEDLFGDKEEMGEELWNNYRKWILINNIPTSSRSRISLEDFIDSYHKIIRGSKKKHAKIMSILKTYNSQNHYAEMGIDKFINSRHWEALEETYNSSINGEIKQYGSNQF